MICQFWLRTAKIFFRIRRVHFWQASRNIFAQSPKIFRSKSEDDNFFFEKTIFPHNVPLDTSNAVLRTPVGIFPILSYFFQSSNWPLQLIELPSNFFSVLVTRIKRGLSGSDNKCSTSNPTNAKLLRNVRVFINFYEEIIIFVTGLSFTFSFLKRNSTKFCQTGWPLWALSSALVQISNFTQIFRKYRKNIETSV